MKNYLLTFLVFALVFSEVAFNFNQKVGFVFYISLIAFFLLFLSNLEPLTDYGRLAIIFMIIPIVRITGVFISLDFFWKIVVSYGLLLFLSFFYSVRFKLDHGHKKEKLRLLPVSIVLGVVLGFIGNYFFSFDKYSWMIYLILFIAYSEEILFRGMIQKLIKKNYGTQTSILVTSLLFGMFSLIAGGVLFALFMAFVGIIIGVVYDKTENIFLAVIINVIIQYFLFCL